MGKVSMMTEGKGKMPTYDYKCKMCGSTFEVKHPMDYVPKTCQDLINLDYCYKTVDNGACGDCVGNVEMIYASAPSTRFKGTGFYETDYKKM